MRAMAIHIRNDLDGAAASWCAEEYLSSKVMYLPALMSKYPDRIQGYDRIYLFSTNSSDDELRKLCSRNAEVHIWTKDYNANRIEEWKEKPVNLFPLQIKTSYSRTISYKLKIPESTMLDCIDSISQDATGPDLDCILEYLNLAIPYNRAHFKQSNELLNNNYQAAVNIGSGVKLGIDHVRAGLVKRAKPIVFEGIDSLIVNCAADFARVADDLSLISDSGLGITWRCSGRNTYHFSLSSTPISNINCGKLARKYGGSGFKYKGGFRLESLDKLRDILNGIYKRKHSIMSN